MWSLLPIQDDSITYIERQLENGRGLAGLIRSCDLRKGVVSAFLPDEDIWRSAGYATEAMRNKDQESEAITALANHFTSLYGLTSNSRKVLICEFADGAKSPPVHEIDRGHNAGKRYQTLWIRGAERPSFNNELWFVGPESQVNDVRQALLEELWFPAVGMLTRLPDDLVFSDNQVISYDLLRTLVMNLEAVIVGAWDSMNYLVWSPK